ncbi:MAG TPA: DUF6279 family lipoprotein [Burkholderiaceae bacterium]|nr:DUF6279 family lipoprotein [Burkholderiaceae bacterium]
MITIESGAMRGFLSRLRWIIGAGLLALVLAGCSAVRLGYSQGPSLAYWWIDGYVDVSGEQTPRLRAAIDDWFDWHRRTQLPEYAALLARAQREVMEPASAAQMCAWRDLVLRRVDAAVDRALPAVAPLAMTLTPEQLRHVAARLAKGSSEWRADFAQPDRAERARAVFKRTLERYESFYGRLDEAQRARLAQLLAASSFDPERWLTEREARHADLLRTLASLRTAPDPEQARQLAVALGERLLRSPRAEYRDHAQRTVLESCAQAATMHNLMTPAQRARARERLKAWEEDARTLAAAAHPAAQAREL